MSGLEQQIAEFVAKRGWADMRQLLKEFSPSASDHAIKVAVWALAADDIVRFDAEWNVIPGLREGPIIDH